MSSQNHFDWANLDRTPIWFREAPRSHENSVKAAGGPNHSQAGSTTALSVDQIFLSLGINFMAAGKISPPSCSKYWYGTDRALNKQEHGRAGNNQQSRGATENAESGPDKMVGDGVVWDALAEQDELKRDRLLHAADAFLQGNNQEPDPALPLRGR